LQCQSQLNAPFFFCILVDLSSPFGRLARNAGAAGPGHPSITCWPPKSLVSQPQCRKGNCQKHAFNWHWMG